MYPKSLEELIDYFKCLPGVGTKTAERYALTILDLNEQDIKQFANAMISVSENIKKCEKCHNISEGNLCTICSDKNRNDKLVCVVQSKGIMPNDINIKTLIDKVDTIDEIIIATSSNIDGETTALYLNKLLSDKDTLVTRIAFGLPIGGYLDYADELTLIKAVEGRKVIKER